MDITEEKKKSLLDSIRKAGYAIGKMYYECNKESLEEDEDDEECEGRKRYQLPDGRPQPHWLYEGIGDQFYHSLNQIEDYIRFDPVFFGKETCEQRGEAWNILNAYFKFDEVEEAAYKGWDDFLKDEYGVDWEEKY